MSATKKNAPVPVEKFAKAVIDGRKAGKSNAEIAALLGMASTSFDVRVATVSRDLRNATAIYRIGKEKNTLTGEEVAVRFKLKIADLHKEDTLNGIDAVIVTPGRSLPGSTGVSRTRTNWGAMASSLFGADE